MMKKVISFILALAMAASLLCTAAFAEGSKTQLFDLVGCEAEDADLEYEISETQEEAPAEEAVSTAITAALEAIAVEDVEENPNIDAELLRTLSFENLTLAAMADFTSEKHPCSLVFYGEGTEDINVIVLVKYALSDEWKLIYAGLAGEFSIEVEENGTYAVYVVG